MKNVGVILILLLNLCIVSCKDKQSSTFEYYSDGRIKSKTGPINDSVSLYLNFYENGHIKDSMMVLNGYLSGEVKHFSESGMLRQKWIWKDGLPNGVCTTYYESGRIMDVLVYQDSVPVGNMVKYFDVPGNRVMYTANNVSLGGKKWVNWYVRYDSSGKIIKTSPGIKKVLAPKKVVLGDSLRIAFEIQYPEYPKTKVYFGDYDAEFKLRDTSSIKGYYGSQKEAIVFVPTTKVGRQTVRGVLENYKILDSLKTGLTKTEGKMIYWSYDYEVLPRN